MDVYLDVDRTLFNTDLFDELQWGLLAREFGVSAERERSRQRQFYVYDGGAYFYDFTAHVYDVGCDVAKVYECVRRSELADGRLEYDGAGELVEWIQTRGRARLLTYGADDYQRLKVALCPSLQGLETITTQASKGHFFAAQTLSNPVWMVDDKPIGDELPEYVKFVQATGYNGVKYAGGGLWAQSLSEVIDILQVRDL